MVAEVSYAAQTAAVSLSAEHSHLCTYTAVVCTTTRTAVVVLIIVTLRAWLSLSQEFSFTATLVGANLWMCYNHANRPKVQVGVTIQ